MNVEASEVAKLRITGATHLDPISVFIEDLGERKIRSCPNIPDYTTKSGKVTLECFGESWSAYWGGMGDRSTIDFFLSASIDYLVGCFARGSEIDRHVFDGSKLEAAARRCIIDCRRGRTRDWECGPLDRDEARELYDAADYLSAFDSAEGLMHSPGAGELLTKLFGEEWHYTVSDKAMAAHPKRLYLARIVDAVQQALRQRIESHPIATATTPASEQQPAIVLPERCTEYAGDRDNLQWARGANFMLGEFLRLNPHLQQDASAQGGEV
ncbi:hypothetical protein PSGK_19040 [Pseudomonas solani]|uniref:hypothetical protein n=1 Tax=Pseudomonas solani TaxID=2731552 RepID=UPI0035BE91A8